MISPLPLLSQMDLSSLESNPWEHPFKLTLSLSSQLIQKATEILREGGVQMLSKMEGQTSGVPAVVSGVPRTGVPEIPNMARPAGLPGTCRSVVVAQGLAMARKME